MFFVRLFALALLIHEAFWLCQDGSPYFTCCFLPVLGLSLTSSQVCAAHLTLVGLAGAILVWPGLWLLYPALLVVLSVVIASYSLRLSNHLVIVWFMALLLCLDLLFRPPGSRGAGPTPFLFAGVQMIMLLTYLLAFFHKLNPEYLSLNQSCGACLGRAYLENRRVRNRLLVKAYPYLAIYGTLALEAAVPALLLIPATRPLGLCLAILLHLPFGLLCHVHFSTVMYAGLAAFVPPGAWPGLLHALFSLGWPALLGLALGLWIGGRFGVTSGFHHRRAGLALQWGFGAYTAAALGAGLILLRGGPLPAPGWAAVGGAGKGLLACVGLAFLANGFSPYLGLKTEFSLAMFSNLRPVPWRHCIVPTPWRPFALASYVQVEQIEGLPERGRHKGGWMTDLVLTCLLKPQLWQYSSYFFHEGLKRVCRTAGPTPVIRVVYVERGERHEVQDYARERAARPPHYLRAALFPYKLPRDPSIPQCA